MVLIHKKSSLTTAETVIGELFCFVIPLVIPFFMKGAKIVIS